MIRHLLNASADVYRASRADDGRGGKTTTPPANVGTIRVRVAQPSAQERATAAQLGAVLEYVVHTVPDSNVQRGDELDTGGPRRLRVQAVLWDSSRTYWRLECQGIQGV